MNEPFSNQLEKWANGKSPKTLSNLTEVFAEKSFAIIILLLMFLPALPIPTGGITHIFELIVMLLSVELIIGRRTIWLPKTWQHKSLGSFMQQKTIPVIIRRVRWFERFSRKRLGSVINHQMSLRFIGVIFLIFTIAAFVSPPFAGLDTLPALGAVIIALSLILEDVLLLLIGSLVGSLGVGLVIATGGVTLHFISKIIHIL